MSVLSSLPFITSLFALKIEAMLKTIHWVRLLAFNCVLVALLIGLGACRGGSEDEVIEEPVERKDTNLTFNDVTLEQADTAGKLLWKVRSKRVLYSKDRKIARLQGPDGEIFEEGKPVIRFKALKGRIEDNGKKLFLEDNVVATDIRNGVVLRGKLVEWEPDESRLQVRDNFTVVHKQFRGQAEEGNWFLEKKQLEVLRKVVAVSKDPNLQYKGDRILWNIDKQTVLSDKPLELYRYKGKTLTDRATGNRADVDLKAKTVLLRQNGLLNLVDPPVDIASNAMLWNMDEETAVSNVPVRVLHRKEQVVFDANQGKADLGEEIFYLIGNVRGVGQSRRARLNSDLLTWYSKNDRVEAEGKVFYVQEDPPLVTEGPKAVGFIKDETIVVDGGSTGGRVSSYFIPEEE